MFGINIYAGPTSDKVHSDLSYMISKSHIQPIRTGALASFPNFAALAKGFDKVPALLPLFDAVEFSARHSDDSQPPNVINFALCILIRKMTTPIVHGSRRSRNS